VRAVNNLASRISDEGDLLRGVELWRDARVLAEQLGTRQLVRFADGVLVWVDYATGDWHGAMRTAYEFIAECEAGFPHYQESGVRGTRALIRHFRGDPDGALEDAQRALELARDAKDPQVLIPELAVLARICADLGRADEAQACLDEGIDLGVEGTAARLAALGGLVWIADALGRRQEVREVIAPLRATPWVEAGLALLARDFARAADLYARIGARTYEADARLRAAEQHVADGRRGAGESELRRALEVFRGVGASRCISTGEALLAGV
jgi:tetratricopeptide (TPR) repeat protein